MQNASSCFAFVGGFLRSKSLGAVFGFYVIASIVTLVVSVRLCIDKDDIIYLWGMAPFFPLFLPLVLFLPVVWMYYIPGSIIAYIFKGYFLLGSSVSESCFFMPCAPQNMKDDDQLYALLAGFVALGIEIAPPMIKRLRKEFRERRTFVQAVEGRLRQFEMRKTGSTPAA